MLIPFGIKKIPAIRRNLWGELGVDGIDPGTQIILPRWPSLQIEHFVLELQYEKAPIPGRLYSSSLSIDNQHLLVDLKIV